MTPNEIVTLARTQFGEATALTISDATFQAWVNQALRELYTDVRPDLLRDLITEDDVVTAPSGNALIPPEWDRIMEVVDPAGTPLYRVDPEVITFIDATATNPFMVPPVGSYALVGQRLSVRPKSTANVTVQHQDPPAAIDFGTDGDNPLTVVEEHWHAPLVHLVTSYAYQQEEDHNAAAHWRGRYASLVGLGAAPVEEQA